MGVNQFSHRARDGPMGAIYGGCSATNDAEIMVDLKTAIWTRTLSI